MTVKHIDTKVGDETTNGLLFEGASISQLGRLFGMDNRNVKSKIHGVEPVGKRAGYPIFAVKDVAPFLVETQLNVDEIEVVINYVRKLNHTNLPKMLTKEFWAAMTAKQRFEENAGDLWRTEKVLEVYGDLVKAIRMPLVLAIDTVGGEVELTERQRTIMTAIIDNLLGELANATAKQFGARAANSVGED